MRRIGPSSVRSPVSGRARFSMFLTCSGIVLAAATSVSAASIPSAPDSDIPCGLMLVGTTEGVADPRGAFTIVVRDLAHNPISGSSVVIDFDACEIDIRVCSVQPFAGVSAECASGPVGEVSAITDGTGTVTMRIVGSGRHSVSSAAAEGFKCATVLVDGVNFGNINVAVVDQNGTGGANPADLSLLIDDNLDGDFEGRSDYNCTNTISPADISLWLSHYFGGGSASSCASYCN